MEKIMLKTFEESDWPDMVRFYEHFYRPGYIFTNRAFFDWNFASPLIAGGPSGQRLLVDDNKIIGIMGALVWPFQARNKATLGECNINLFIDPAYRGRHLSDRLLDNVSLGYKYSLSNGYNARTLSMYERLGKVYAWRMRRFTKCFQSRVIEELACGTPRFIAQKAENQNAVRYLVSASLKLIAMPPSLFYRRVKLFDIEWDIAWDDIRTNYGFTTWRSSQFLNWRYINYPFPLYECYYGIEDGTIKGLVVLRQEVTTYGPIVRIIDLVAYEPYRSDMLSFIEGYCRSLRAVFVDYFAAGAINCNILRDHGYLELQDPDGAALLPMDFNPIRHREAILSLILFRDKDDPAFSDFEHYDFYIVKGDSDQDRAN
jgi:GNAT superfamily N-acetyltransferase